jgi:hypothetical protein
LRAAAEVYTWRQADRRGAESLLKLNPSSIPETTQAQVRHALLAGEERVPADFAAAEEHLQNALLHSPMRSLIWTHLAKYQLLQGQQDLARASLERADDLDPVFPQQRLQAAQLWALLGEQQRAIDLAQTIASLDETGRGDAARALRRLGVPPPEIFLKLDGPELPAEEMISLIDSLSANQPEERESIFAAIPGSLYGDEEFRKVAIESATDPVVYSTALALWAAEVGKLQDTGVPGLLLANPDLSADPFRNDFFLGWQPFPETYRADADWKPGEVLLTYETGRSQKLKTIDWRFYRMIVPPTEQALRVTLSVNLMPPERSLCTLSLRANQKTIRSNPSDWSTEGWQELEVELPPAGESRLVELTLSRERRATTNSSGGEVLMHPPRFELLTTTSPSEEVHAGP